MPHLPRVRGVGPQRSQVQARAEHHTERARALAPAAAWGEL